MHAYKRKVKVHAYQVLWDKFQSEITTLGFRTLCDALGVTCDDVFADLGSGTGNLALQAAREYGVRRHQAQWQQRRSLHE